jgi:microcystin-dependent protein
MEGYLAEVKLFAGNFEPKGWAFCNGQILAIAANTALFSLLGTTFGGNGQTTFGLPDLRGRVPISPGQGPGLPSVDPGEVSGEWNHTLNINEMPAHNHPAQGQINAQSGPGDAGGPTNAYPAASTARDNIYNTGTFDTKMKSDGVQVTVGTSGGSQPHNNMQPYLGLNYIICTQGLYPSRN